MNFRERLYVDFVEIPSSGTIQFPTQFPLKFTAVIPPVFIAMFTFKVDSTSAYLVNISCVYMLALRAFEVQQVMNSERLEFVGNCGLYLCTVFRVIAM